MKKVMAYAAAFILVAALCACGGTPAETESAASPSPSVIATDAGALKDGTYDYRGKKDYEGYHVEGTMVVSNGVIQSMDWKIICNNTGRVFDEKYEEVFVGQDVYIQQCRKDWSGMQTYAPALLETQDLGEVDAISGATWSYNKFKEAAHALLKQAMQ